MQRCTGGEKENENEREWYAIYTRPQWEKKVQTEIDRLAIETFLPLHKVENVWSDRRKIIERPLFPSYLFVCANPRERISALCPSGVVRMVCFNGRPAVVPREQIESVRLAVTAGRDLIDYPYLSSGEQVEIIDGSLQGVTGYVVEMRQTKYVVISVDVMNRAVAVQIDARHLKPLASGQGRPARKFQLPERRKLSIHSQVRH
jgi:transcription antitermination factor NusG